MDIADSGCNLAWDGRIVIQKDMEHLAQDAQRHLRLKISNAEIVTICHGKEIII